MEHHPVALLHHGKQQTVLPLPFQIKSRQSRCSSLSEGRRTANLTPVPEEFSPADECRPEIRRPGGFGTASGSADSRCRRRTSSGLTRDRQMGQLEWKFSQASTQSTWKAWRHLGSRRRSSSVSYRLRQTAHSSPLFSPINDPNRKTGSDSTTACPTPELRRSTDVPYTNPLLPPPRAAAPCLRQCLAYSSRRHVRESIVVSTTEMMAMLGRNGIPADALSVAGDWNGDGAPDPPWIPFSARSPLGR
ncbi:hypothetical protein HPP92_017136 [Vanilla planifolia]|uniref:Uncharacterized protein n=1 Tax=Vanilla planifolia TaxID=51239 RepID=A0A835QC70_VANPL|nr:hypothetical protein HPP92_017136 [Vanilla planifolia]